MLSVHAPHMWIISPFQGTQTMKINPLPTHSPKPSATHFMTSLTHGDHMLMLHVHPSYSLANDGINQSASFYMLKEINLYLVGVTGNKGGERFMTL